MTGLDGGDVLDLYRRALAEFGRRVHAVRPDQWGCPTPCQDWEVRELVNHLVAEQLWVPPLMAGRTVGQGDVGRPIIDRPETIDPTISGD